MILKALACNTYSATLSSPSYILLVKEGQTPREGIGINTQLMLMETKATSQDKGIRCLLDFQKGSKREKQ